MFGRVERTPASPRTRRWGPLALTALAAIVALLIVTLVNCGGSGKKADPANGGGVSNITSATFTPVPPGYTPPPNPTTAALKTRIAEGQTATADARASQTASPDGSAASPASPSLTGVGGRIIFPTPPSSGPNVIYPPASVLQVGDRYVGATIGSFNWVDKASGKGGGGVAPWIDLSEESLIAVPSETATLRFADGAPTPVTTKIEVFAYNGNVAIPTLSNGQPAERPAFVRQTDPLSSSIVQGADPSFAIQLQPGDYIAVATVTWPDVPGADPQYGAQSTQYAYRITVQ